MKESKNKMEPVRKQALIKKQWESAYILRSIFQDSYHETFSREGMSIYYLKGGCNMKKSTKKLLAALLAMTMAFGLAACGSDVEPAPAAESAAETEIEADGEQQPTETAGEAEAPADAVVINFAYDEGVGDATREMIDKFNASQSDIFVESYSLPHDANNLHDDFVNKMVAQDTSVDVMALDVVYISEFAAAGWVNPMDDLYTAEELDAFLPGTVSGATYNGTLYAAPWFTNASALFYRTDLLEQAGIAEVPTTWQGWQDAYEKVKGDVDYAFSFQGIQGEAMVCDWCEFIWSFGGQVLDENGTAVCNSAENIEATQFMADLIGTYAPEGVTTYAESESEQVFKEGKALTCRTWSGTWNVFNDEAESNVAGNVGMTFLPVSEEGDTGHSCMGGLDLVTNVWIDDAHKEAANTFIKWMTSEETEKEFTLISSQPPAVKAIYSDADVLEKIPFYTDFFAIIEAGNTRPLSPNYAEVSDAIQRNVHMALTGEQSVEDALNALQGEVEALSK